MSPGRPKALFIADSFERIYDEATRAEIGALLDVYAPPQRSGILSSTPDLLAEAEIVVSGWGAPRMDEAFLAADAEKPRSISGNQPMRPCEW